MKHSHNQPNVEETENEVIEFKDANSTESKPHSHRNRHTHYHSHHSHHRSNRSSKKNKFVAYFKRNKSVLINILSCSISVVLLVLLAVNFDTNKPTYVNTVNHPDITQSTIKIETSIYSKKISLVNQAISYYMDPSNDSTALETFRAYDGYKGNLNFGMPVPFVYRVTGLPNGVSVESAKLYVSEHKTYQSPQTYVFDVEAGTIQLFNLKTGTQYYYRLDLSLTNNCTIGTTGSFETEATPRILNVDGAINVRDIGGWTSIDNKTIRQGLLFRGSEIDGAVEPKYILTDKGLQQMIGDLGIRFDMDLRSSADNKNGTEALGKNVIHKYYNAPMYSGVLTEYGGEAVKNIFADLSDPDNYPIYLHCTYGRDRTGTICYLLEALLGLSDEDLRKEYELSLFADSYVNYAEFNTFTERIGALEGDTTQEKVERWLLSIGVTVEQIQSIREIFLSE